MAMQPPITPPDQGGAPPMGGPQGGQPGEPAAGIAAPGGPPSGPRQVSPFMGFLAQFRHEHAGMPPEADKAAQALWDSMKSLYSEKGQMSPNADNYSYDDF